MQTGAYQPAKSVIRVSPFEGHTSYAPYTCTQCAEGWCMTARPVGAITINAAGAKDVLDDRCVGCKLCTIACPYGTMFYDTSTRKAFKCNLCGGDPACAHACPTAAIEYADVPTDDWIGDLRASGSATSSPPPEAADADASPRHRRRDRRHERDADDPRGGARALGDHAGQRRRSRTRAWCCRTTWTA